MNRFPAEEESGAAGIPAAGRSVLRGAAPAVAVLFAAVLVYFVTKLGSAEQPAPWVYEVDIRGYFFPAMAWARDEWAQGRVPLWAPGQLLGVPFAAALQPAVFYPLLAPLLVLRPEQALVAHGFLHLLLAGSFTWLYLRVLGASRIAAILGGLAFLFSPDVTSWLYATPLLSNIIWLPALLATVHRASESPTARRCVAVALVTAMLFLSGYTQGAVYSLELAGLYALVASARSLRERRGWTEVSREVRVGAALAGSVTLGLALAAIQVLPTVELAADGVRSLSGLNVFRAGGIGGAEAASTAAFLSVLKRELGWGGLLAAASLFDRRFRAWTLLFWVVLLATCDFQRGNAGIVFPIYYQLPTGNLFQVPERMGFVSGLSAAVLMGLGASVLLRGLRSVPVMRVLATAAMAVLIVVPRYSDDRTPRAWPPLTDVAGLYGDRAVMDAVEPLEGRDDRIFLFAHPQEQRVPPRLGLLRNVHVMSDYEPLLPGSYGRFFSISPDIRWRGRLSPVSGGSAPGRLDFPVDTKVLDALAVRHYVNARGPRGRAPVITEQNSALPRAYAVTHVSYAADDEAALAAVHSPAFDGRREVILTSGSPVIDETPGEAATEVKFVSDKPDEVKLEASCSKDCVVVLSDLAYPGWTAEVDAAPADIVKANYLLRAVAVPAGRHAVSFSYRPQSVRLGAAVTALASMLVLALAWRGRRSQSRG